MLRVLAPKHASEPSWCKTNGKQHPKNLGTTFLRMLYKQSKALPLVSIDVVPNNVTSG